MKSGSIQSFLRDWLSVRGVEPAVLESELWAFPVPRDLRDRFGRMELAFAFSRRALAKNPKAELATVGNPIFDRLLAVAREEGRFGVAYQKPPSPAARPPAPSKVPPIGDIPAGKPIPIYQASYHLVF